MSDDLISRQAAIDIVFRSPFFSDSLTEELRALPSVQPKKKTGHWIWRARERNSYTKVTGPDSMGEEHTITYHEGGKYEEPCCSECNAIAAHNFYNYCPKCGVKMEDNENEDR